MVVEKAGPNFSAYLPDLPGCVATGATPEETKANMRAAVGMHLQGLREDGLPIPLPSATDSRLNEGGRREGQAQIGNRRRRTRL
jgi:predicted RNase H-like HicB family nuclease